jgi:hypothetical protein
MHGLFDFDLQTKFLHVGYSVLGMLVSMVVLVKFKPPLLPRMIVGVILGFVLVYCLTTAGSVEKVQTITSIGWFVLGLLFGIGRGEFVIEYLACRFFGAGDVPSTLDESAGDAIGATAANAATSAQAGAEAIQKEGADQSPGGGESESSSLEIPSPPQKSKIADADLQSIEIAESNKIADKSSTL